MSLPSVSRAQDRSVPISSFGLTPGGVLLIALSLSIGWGIRGNFGHEYGAMIAGALSALAACLVAGREDWRRRAAYFAFFGAIGWSFGGSMSYGYVIAYAQSGHGPTVIYGFACLFVIGFLWAAVGGAATALPAILPRRRLTEFFPPLIAVFIAWTLQDLVVWRLDQTVPDRRHESFLYWYDTDWLSVLTAMAAVLAAAVFRRRLCLASVMILFLCVGWWVGFGGLVVLLGLRMCPPRGDSWAGMVGMVAAMLVWLIRRRLHAAAWAGLVAGVIGGLGFSSAVLFKMIEMKSGYRTNWHSILEQTYGFINGLGIAAAFGCLAARLPVVDDAPTDPGASAAALSPRGPAAPEPRRWTDAFAVFFVLVVITYVNIEKNPEEWVKAKVMPAEMYGLSAWGWFNIGYLAVAVAAALLLARHLRTPLALVPASWLGKGQLLYVAFLWWMVVGNFERALSGFAPQRLVTEGVILINAVLATVLVLWLPRERLVEATPGPTEAVTSGWRLGRVACWGAVVMIVAVLAQSGLARAFYGQTPAEPGHQHFRFGPKAEPARPVKGLSHP
ncbi:MAG: hypothetical protein HRF43_03330 [Phycisphaerae bacterium]|jgi:hypothetical protein